MMRFVIVLAVCFIAYAQFMQAEKVFEINRTLRIMYLEQKTH